MRVSGQYVILLFLFSFLDAVGQDSTLFINFEAGRDGIGSNFEKKAWFREIDENTGFFGPRVISLIEKSFAGVKIEKKTAGNRVGFSTGVRFTHLKSILTKSGVPDFFYILHRQTGTTTEYLQIKQLTERSNYLGIPLEVCYYVPSVKTVRFSLTAGLEWSYLLGSKTDVLFSNTAMEIYQSEVAEIIGEFDRWYATIYARPGLLIGKNKPVFGCGITLPVVITNTVSTLNTPIAGAGFHLQFYFAIKE